MDEERVLEQVRQLTKDVPSYKLRYESWIGQQIFKAIEFIPGGLQVLGLAGVANGAMNGDKERIFYSGVGFLLGTVIEASRRYHSRKDLADLRIRTQALEIVAQGLGAKIEDLEDG